MKDAAVEPWVEPYLPDFAVIHRILDRTSGFAFQPIETPSPDLARALAAWLLRACGLSTQVIYLTSDMDWLDLASRLEQGPAEGPAVTLVIDADAPIDDMTAQRSLARLNLARDVIARSVQRTILWCGSARLHRWTRQFAPDLWSIAASPYDIALRRPTDLPLHLRELAPLWWTGAVSADETALARDVTTHDRAERVRAALRLAEARLTRGDQRGAQDILFSVASLVDDEIPLLRPRWSHLLTAATATPLGSDAEPVAALRRAVAHARARSDVLSEAALHRALAHALLATDGARPEDAIAELLRARELYLQRGDLVSALEVAVELVGDYTPALSEDVLESLAEESRDAAASLGDPRSTAVSTVIDGIVALSQRRLDEAARCAAEVIAYAQGADERAAEPVLLLAHALAVDTALLRGDLDRALEHATALMALTEAAALPALEFQAHRLLANIRVQGGQPYKAAYHLLAAMSIAGDLNEDSLFIASLVWFAECADAAGATVVASALFADMLPSILTATPQLAERWIAARRARHGTSDPLTISAEKVATASDETTRETALDELARISRSIGEDLERAEVDPLDPDSWPLRDRMQGPNHGAARVDADE